MTITTDSAIAREGFSANYTIRERSLPLGHEEDGEKLAGGRGDASAGVSKNQRGFFTSRIYPEKNISTF